MSFSFYSRTCFYTTPGTSFGGVTCVFAFNIYAADNACGIVYKGYLVNVGGC